MCSPSSYPEAICASERARYGQEMPHLSDGQVRDLLPSPARTVELMRETLLALADGSASVTSKSQVISGLGDVVLADVVTRGVGE